MDLIIILFLIAADQLTKYFYVAAGAPTVALIPGVLELCYVENRGAAWGMMGDHQLVLYIFSTIVTIALCAYFVWKYKSMKRLMRIALALVIAGAAGNLIDRFVLNYVRDMIYVKLIDFPVFNVADMAITIGGVLLFVYLIFFDRDTKQEKQPDNASYDEEITIDMPDDVASDEPPTDEKSDDTDSDE